MGSLLAGCGGEVGVNHEGSEPADSEAVFEGFSPAADARDNADRETHSAVVSCQGGTATWSQQRGAWNSNSYTAGTYYCDASVPTTSSGFSVSVNASSPTRNGSLQGYCNNGTWQWTSYSCDGRIVTTASASGISTVCSSSEPVHNMWAGWYLADLKRCADYDGLEWWVNQYNSNNGCLASTNYDGYGSKDLCFRANFRQAADSNQNSYSEAQATGHIAAASEFALCGSIASYPWSSVSTSGTQCKYRP